MSASSLVGFAAMRQDTPGVQQKNFAGEKKTGAIDLLRLKTTKGGWKSNIQMNAAVQYKILCCTASMQMEKSSKSIYYQLVNR